MPIIHPPKGLMVGDVVIRIFYLAYMNAAKVREPPVLAMAKSLTGIPIEMSEVQVAIDIFTRDRIAVIKNGITYFDVAEIHGRPVNLRLGHRAAVEGSPAVDNELGKKAAVARVDGIVEYPDGAPTKAKQTWCHAIPTYADLINRAIRSFQNEKKE